MRVLVVNAGSSSMKLRLLDGHDAVERTVDVPSGPGGVDPVELTGLLRDWPEPDVVGHRVVHGGGPSPDPSSSTRTSAGRSVSWPTSHRCTSPGPSPRSTP